MQQSPGTLRSFRFPLFVVYLLFSLTAAAQVFVRPAGPDTRTPVTITVPLECPGGAQATFSIAGNVIRVVGTDLLYCGDPPPMREWRDLPIGLLTAGQYRVEFNQGAITYSTTFIVRDAEPRPITVVPFAIPSSQLAPIRARINAGHSQFEPLCLPGHECRVFVDGVEAAHVQLDAEGHIWFTPPVLPPGLKRVGVDSANLYREAADAIYYFGLNAAPERSIFERLLFPMLSSDLPGANGSRWVTEAVISNPRRAFIENRNHVTPYVCIDYPCLERLGPGELVEFDGDGYPRGVALLSPWSDSPYLSFALRARDVSRQAEGFGTEVPVVRENELFIGTDIALLDVPLQAGYRSKLRVYAFDILDSAQRTASVEIVRANGSRDRHTLELSRDCGGFACHYTPWYAELDLPSNLGRADVFVSTQEQAQAWSFISVTNNETQQVTLVTPNGQGKGRCEFEACGGTR